MAEIHVEPRRRSRTWLWVLLLVLVLIVAAWVLFGQGTVSFSAFGGTFVVDAVNVAWGGVPPGGAHG